MFVCCMMCESMLCIVRCTLSLLDVMFVELFEYVGNGVCAVCVM